MPPAVAFIGAVAGAAGAVASIAGAVVSTIGAVIGPVLAAVGSVVTGIVTTIGAVLAPIINTVGGIVEGISGVIKGGVEFVRTAIAEPLGNIVQSIKAGIGKIAEVVTAPLKPILEPIAETLGTVKDFVAGTQTWINTQLAPVAELVELVNTISAVAFVKQILDGTTSITKIIGDVADDSGVKTAQAIAVLWRETAKMGADIVENVRDHYTILRDTIDDTDERLRKDMDLAIKYVRETIQGEIDSVTDVLSDRISLTDLELARIQRRIEDLPFFQEMLIKAID